MNEKRLMTLGLILLFLLVGVTAHVSAISIGEAVNNTNLSWSTDGDDGISWFVDGDAVRSGHITDDQATWLETSVEGPGEISFYWNVSSELGIDTLGFYIDDELQDSISGTDENWWQATIPVTEPGPHTLKWMYTKDYSATVGLDAGWVDKVTWNNQPIAPTANFASDLQSGETPLIVQFTDLSTGMPTSWSWNFGDGGTSNEQNPGHTYSTAGDYTVSLNVTNSVGGDQIVKTGYLHISALSLPIAAFSYGPEGIIYVNDPVSFYSESTGRIDSYTWSFGDGTPAESGITAMHQYTAPGSYTAQLSVSNALGPATTSKTITVLAAPSAGMQQPVANFSANVTNGSLPLTVQFTDSSINEPSSWRWTFFDDHTSSTLQNPVHTFTSSGTFQVMLTALNSVGNNTTSQYITVTSISPPVSDFTANVTNGTAPLAVGFTDTSTNTPTSWSWTFGDGTSATTRSPTHTYTTAGDYTVNLTATNAGGSNTITKTRLITVRSVPTTVSTTPTTVSTTPTTVSTTPTTVSTTPTIVSTTPTTVPTSSIGGALDNTGLVWSTDGDEGRSWFVDGDSVRSGHITDDQTTWLETTVDGSGEISFFWSVSSEGGADYLNFYIDNELQDSISGSNGWESAAFAVKGSGAHTIRWVYSKDYSLSVGLDAGRVDKVVWNNQPIAPTANFASDHQSGEAPLAVQFTDLSTGMPTSWFWNFGDGGTSTAQNPGHTYATPGDYTVSLTATNTVNSDQIEKTGYIHISALSLPVAAFSYTPETTISVNDWVSFSSDSTGRIDSYSWSFGDGSPNGNEIAAMHQYAAPGNYTVQLTVSNTLGHATTSKTIIIVAAPPSANFTANVTNGTAPLAVGFTDTSTGTPTSWLWTFGDGTSATTSNPTHTYATAGSYTVNLTVTNTGGHNTIAKTGFITIKAPTSPTTTTTTTTVSTTATIQTPPSTIQTPVPPTEPTSGQTPVSTTATVTPTVTVTSSQPDTVDFTWDKPVKAGVPVNFTDTSTIHPTIWFWYFDGQNFNVQNPSHTFTTAGTYQVFFTAANASGIWRPVVMHPIVVEENLPSEKEQVPGGEGMPADPDHDGLYEDLNGNGVLDFNDVVLFFSQMDWIAEHEPVADFDFNHNGQIDFNDVVLLFNKV